MTMKKFTETMHNISGAIMLIGQTLIAAFFVIIALILILIVEIQRVAHGIQLFEQGDWLAYSGAFVIVMTLLTVEFVIHYVETKEGYIHQRRSDWSFRLFFNDLKYWLGYENKEEGVVWQPRLKSPAHEIKKYSRLLTGTILALAVGGSMTDAIAGVQGNWYTGLVAIATESTLLEMVSWLGGGFYALALVLGAQRLTSYVAQRAAETLDTRQSDKLPQSEEIAPVVTPISMPTLAPDCEPLPEYQNYAPVYEPEIDGDSIFRQLLDESRDLGHIYYCENCDYDTGYKDTDANAKRALATHQRHCEAS